MSAPFPGQCFSEVRGGQVITYASPVSSSSWVITSSSQTAATYVRAVQVNGYIFASSTGSPSTSASGSTPGSSSATPTASSSYTSTSSPSSSSTSAATTSSAPQISNASLSPGATIGIAVGVSMALILLRCAIGVIFFRRYCRAKTNHEACEGATSQFLVNNKNQPLFKTDRYVAHEIGEREPTHEMQ
jgi:hypothetical protein